MKVVDVVGLVGLVVLNCPWWGKCMGVVVAPVVLGLYFLVGTNFLRVVVVLGTGVVVVVGLLLDVVYFADEDGNVV